MRSFILAVAAAVAFAGCSSGSGTVSQPERLRTANTVAIVSVTGIPDSTNAENQVADMFANQFQAKGYQVTNLSQAESRLAAANITAGTPVTAENAPAIGKAVNADSLLVVTVPQFGNKISMNAQLLDATDGSSIWQANGEGDTEKMWVTAGSAAAGAVAGAVIGGSKHRVAGAVIGGAAGGAGGYFLSPKQETITRQVVEKMTASLPRRQ